jgi:hypothetical protein
MKLYQAIKGRAWEDDNSGKLFQQLRGIGDISAKKILSAGISDLIQLEQTSASRIGALLGKQANNFGAGGIEDLRKVPLFQVSLDVVEENFATVKIKIAVGVVSFQQGDSNRWRTRSKQPRDSQSTDFNALRHSKAPS